MSEEFIPTLTHATERDIDLLLVEELYSSREFVAWVLARADIAGCVRASRVLHSKRRTRNRREIDIFLECALGDGTRAALLIENKLDASEQPDQAESYREELNAIAGAYAQAAMIIVCPSSYLVPNRDFTSKFDARITYEDLARYFQAGQQALAGSLADRMEFRAEILEQAIHKSRRGYTPAPNEVIGDFNARYVALLEEIMPEIRPGPSMLRPASPDDSTSMIFDQDASLAELPPVVRPRRFAHELGCGLARRANYVAVTFAGWGAALPQVRDQVEADAAALGASFSAKTPNKARPNPGLVMSIPTEPVDNQGDFDVQKELLIAGINRAGELRRWLLANQAVLARWKQAVDQYKVRP